MTQAAVATEIHQALDVHGNVAAQVAFDLEALFEHVTDAGDFVFADVVRALLGVDLGAGEDAERRDGTDPVEVGQRNTHLLVARQVNTSNTSHFCLQTVTMPAQSDASKIQNCMEARLDVETDAGAG